MSLREMMFEKDPLTISQHSITFTTRMAMKVSDCSLDYSYHCNLPPFLNSAHADPGCYTASLAHANPYKTKSSTEPHLATQSS